MGGGDSVEDTWQWGRGQTGQGREEEELSDTPFLICGHTKDEEIKVARKQDANMVYLFV